MLKFLSARLLRMALVLTGVMLITFLLMHAIPGNPWSSYSSSPRLMMGLDSDKYFQRELNRRFGLDLPLWRQFTRYVIGDVDDEGEFFCGVICANLGPSIRMRGKTVQQVLFQPPPGAPLWKSQFGYSFRLVALAALFTLALGIPLGIINAVKPRSTPARTITVLMALLTAIPNFVLGLLAIIVAALWLRLIPVVPDWTIPTHWIIPAAVLGVAPMASVTRVTRAAVMNLLAEDFVRTARAKGLGEARVLLVHVLRNSLAPIITFAGPALMEMFAGLVIVENLFGFPGIGKEYWQAVLELDYPMIMGVTLFFATGMVLTQLLVNILCALLDPRLRSSRLAGIE